jgi:NAD(P)-dependent dehydrogenase (short-subunit alcohol dehydrogenase family)
MDAGQTDRHPFYNVRVKDKTVLITGSTSGIGLAAALALSRLGAIVILHGRNQERCERALETLRRQGAGKSMSSLTADLSVQANVRELARQVIEKHGRLDVLINNAGAVFIARRRSADGIEMTFANNHLAYFLLTDLLLPMLKASPSARIVNVASHAHFGNPLEFDNLELKRGYMPLKAYGRSKFANVLFTYALVRRLEGTNVTVNGLHPGFVATGMGSNNGAIVRFFAGLVMSTGIPPEEGARTVVYLASSGEVERVSGGYFYQQKPMRSDTQTYEIEDQERLWEISAKMTGLSG